MPHLPFSSKDDLKKFFWKTSISPSNIFYSSIFVQITLHGATCLCMGVETSLSIRKLMTSGKFYIDAFEK